MTKKLILVGLLLLLASALFAFDGYITVYNETGYDVYYLYVSNEYSSGWEADVLGSDVLMAGESITVWLEGYPSPYFDIRLQDSDGDTYTVWGLDVSMYDAVITWEDMD